MLRDGGEGGGARSAEDVLSQVIILWILRIVKCALEKKTHKKQKQARQRGAVTPQTGRWWRKAGERDEKNDKGDDGQTRLAADRQCKVLMRAVQQLWASGATGGNKWAENSKAHDKETVTIVACSCFHHDASGARLFDFHNCIKRPVACASQGSYQPTAALTCPLQFTATHKHRRTSLCLNCRINLHFKTSLPNCRFYFLLFWVFFSLRESSTGRKSFTGSAFFFFLLSKWHVNN